MLKAILFDFDGTLGDTLPLCIAGFRRAIEPLAGRSISDAEIIATFGPSEEGTIRALAPHAYERGVADYLKFYRELHDMCPAPFPGVPELLAFLRARGVTVALVTGKGKRSCDISLEHYGIASLLDAVETGSPEGPCKPERIKAVLRRFSLKPEETLYVGDTPGDVEAAHSVGVPAAAAAWAGTADPDALRAARPEHLFFSIPEFRLFLADTLQG